MRNILTILLSFTLFVTYAQTECMDGSLIFKEDFGGNLPTDPQVGTTPVASMSSVYTMKTTRDKNAFSGMYLTTKLGHDNGADWHWQDDHTYPDDTTRGYFLQVDGRGSANDVFYSATIDNLCSGIELYFSAWMANVFTVYRATELGYGVAEPNFKFSMVNPATNAELAAFTTGPVPMDTMSTIYSYDDRKKSSKWHQYGFKFAVPAGLTSVKLQIMNSTSGYTGNDFGIDDIEIYLCTPPVDVSGEVDVCQGNAITLNGSFTNDGTFDEPLAYQWLFSATGEINSAWTTISGATTTNLSLNNVQQADSGYYRLVVSSQTGIVNPNCRAASTPYLLNVKACSDDVKKPVDFKINITEPLCADSLLQFSLNILNDTIDSISVILNGNHSYYLPTYSVLQDVTVNLKLVEGANRIEMDVYRADTLVRPRITFDYFSVTSCAPTPPPSKQPDFNVDIDSVLCGDSLLHFTFRLLEGEIDSLKFSLPQHAALYLPTSEAVQDTMVAVELRPGIYPISVTGYSADTIVKTLTYNIKVLYPSSVIMQKWNDFMGVLTSKFNGGYHFVAYQWYKDGILLNGEVNDYIYQPLEMGAEYSVLLTDTTGLQLLCCPLVAQEHTDVYPYPQPIVTKGKIGVSLPADAQVLICDILGEQIFKGLLSEGSYELVDNLKTGIYIMQIMMPNEQLITYKIFVS